MADDFKTKILIEKSKQEKKANLFLKYLTILSLVFLSGIVFFVFKNNFFDYFSIGVYENKILEDTSAENEKNTKIDAKDLLEIDIYEECKKYNLVEKICEFKNLYQVVLKKLNEESKIILSNDNIEKIYEKKINSFFKLKQNSLTNFSNNFFEKAYVELIEAKKIFNTVKEARNLEFTNNMKLAKDAYLKRNESSAKEFIFTAEKYISDDLEMLSLKDRIFNIKKIIQLENDIKVANSNKNNTLEINLIEKIKKLDKSIEIYDSRLYKLKLAAKEKNFNNLILEVQGYIADNETTTAKNKLELAKKIFPKNDIIASLREDINNLEKTNKINSLKIEADNLILQDQWKDAEKKYQEILLMDNTNIYAVDGLSVAKNINNLIQAINTFNNKPMLLIKDENLNRVNLLLKDAKIFVSKSKKLLKEVNLLERNLTLANKEALVNIKSDNKTNIKLKKIGIIGKVTSKTLSLKAGKYIFEGRRDGYKTVLVEKYISLDEKNIYVEIICDERI